MFRRRTPATRSIVFLLLAPTFIVLGIGDAVGNDPITHIGGVHGIATALAAW